MKKVIFTFLLVCLGVLGFSQEETKDESKPAVIEKVPMYPGCEPFTTNAQQKKCMSEMIMRHVATKFNYDVTKDLDLPIGLNRVLVVFKIDATGEIIDIEARASHKELEEEAVRIVSLLPKMIPGTVNEEAVVVPYTLPIMFNVEETKKSKKRKRRKSKS